MVDAISTVAATIESVDVAQIGSAILRAHAICHLRRIASFHMHAHDAITVRLFPHRKMPLVRVGVRKSPVHLISAASEIALDAIARAILRHVDLT